MKCFVDKLSKFTMLIEEGKAAYVEKEIVETKTEKRHYKNLFEKKEKELGDAIEKMKMMKDTLEKRKQKVVKDLTTKIEDKNRKIEKLEGEKQHWVNNHKVRNLEYERVSKELAESAKVLQMKDNKIKKLNEEKSQLQAQLEEMKCHVKIREDWTSDFEVKTEWEKIVCDDFVKEMKELKTENEELRNKLCEEQDGEMYLLLADQVRSLQSENEGHKSKVELMGMQEKSNVELKAELKELKAEVEKLKAKQTAKDF